MDDHNYLYFPYIANHSRINDNIMPRYDYICKNKKCDTEFFEEIMGFNDTDKVRCPDCNKLTDSRKAFYLISHQWLDEPQNWDVL